MEKALTITEVAEVLSLPLGQVYKLSAAGKLPFMQKLGNQWRAFPSQIEKFMAGQLPVRPPKRRQGGQVRVSPRQYDPNADPRLQ